MARYLVMKRDDNNIEVVKEEQSQIVSLTFGDFIEELASPHYERYGVRSVDYWRIDDDNIKSFDRLWNFCGYSIDDFVGLFSSFDSYDGVDI